MTNLPFEIERGHKARAYIILIYGICGFSKGFDSGVSVFKNASSCARSSFEIILGFSFSSDPAGTTSVFAQLGRVRNGVFSH